TRLNTVARIPSSDGILSAANAGEIVVVLRFTISEFTSPHVVIRSYSFWSSVPPYRAFEQLFAVMFFKASWG
ncbi:hypothetical protein A2U01_0031236, partial [Trifolium medium]|nr:hypothetical protein [Trifolium medium]